jgi:hypothetical protein
VKTRAIAVALGVLVLAGAAVCFAADANVLGTWKLNESKSKLAPGTPKNTTVKYVAAGDSIRVTIDGVDAAGKATHSEWTGKFDGMDYAVTGDPASEQRSYKRIDPQTLAFSAKKDGKVAYSGRIVVSADGMTRTVTLHATDSMGKKITSVAVYDKE